MSSTFIVNKLYCLKYCMLISCMNHACETHEPHASTQFDIGNMNVMNMFIFKIFSYITSNLL